MTRRTFYIDENLPHVLAEPLEKIYRQHRFRTPDRENLRGWLDIPLLEELSARGVDAIITQDAMQLENADEREALRKYGLHWVGLPPIRAKGTQLYALFTAVVMPGIHHVLERWADVPTAYHLPTPSLAEPHDEPL